MAATFTQRAAGEGFNPSKVPGAYFDTLVEVTAGTTDYVAGGYGFGVSQLQTLTGGAGSLIESVEVADHWRTAAGGGTSAFLAVWDAVNGKVQAYGMNAAAGVSNALTEVANSTANMNGLRCTLRVRWH
jgi:hypothetical protein